MTTPCGPSHGRLAQPIGWGKPITSTPYQEDHRHDDTPEYCYHSSFACLDGTSGQLCMQCVRPEVTKPTSRPSGCWRTKEELVTNWSQLSAALNRIPKSDKWNPRVNHDRERGVAAAVYPIVAPATVVVRCGHGHGTGFVVDPKGWILTNHHVYRSRGGRPKDGRADGDCLSWLS